MMKMKMLGVLAKMHVEAEEEQARVGE